MTIAPKFHAAALLTTSAFLFSIMGILIREASQDINNANIVFARNFFGLLCFIPLLTKRNRHIFKTARLKDHALRSLFGLSAMYCFFYALAHLPLANAMLFTYAAPVFVPLLAWTFLNESLNQKILYFCLLGLGGVILITQPDQQIWQNTLSLIGISASLLAAAAFVSIRAMSNSEPPLRIVFYFTFFSTIVSAIPLPWSYQSLTTSSFFVLMLIGLVAIFSQMMMSKAYTMVPMSQIAPFAFSAVVFSAMLGVFIYDEIPNWLTLIGGICIFLSCIGTMLMQTPTSNILRKKQHDS